MPRDDFTASGRAYDLILDLAAHRPASAYRGSLRPGGRYLYVGGSVATLLQVLLIGPVIGRAEGKKIRLLGAVHATGHQPGCRGTGIAGVTLLRGIEDVTHMTADCVRAIASSPCLTPRLEVVS